MTKHLILLTDAHEAPAPALVEVLRSTDIGVLVEVMREAEVAARMIEHDGLEKENQTENPQPVAVLYEVVAGADMMEVHTVIEHATLIWPGAPLVACRRPNRGTQHQGLRVLESSTLRRLGFRAVADEPAQLPALLREIEERGSTGELVRPLSIESAFLPGGLLLPPRLTANALRAAFELVSSLHFTGDQKSAAQTALVGLGPLVRADRWTIYLTSEASGAEAALEPLAVRGLTSSEREIPEDDWRRALLGDAIVLLGSESKAAREAAVSMETVKRKEGARRIIAVPLMSSERVLGVLEAVREGQRARAFSKPDVELLGALAVPLASALSNSVRIAEAERLSQTDDLTKLHNARYLRQFLLNEIKRARRYGSSVAALFLDLDDFKQINDMHGHLVGSHVLMEMASVILASVRDTDVVARYGGDEFVVILPETAIEQATRVAERLREKVARHEFTGGRRLHLKLTASFGLASFPQHASSPQQLIASADTAMYEAKAARKNCVRLAVDPLSSREREKAIS